LKSFDEFFFVLLLGFSNLYFIEEFILVLAAVKIPLKTWQPILFAFLIFFLINSRNAKRRGKTLQKMPVISLTFKLASKGSRTTHS
jgi:hypothetical protein